ncbi:hypothetical protein V8J88_16490 [Massilia sp. W12]|uniref:hypothetical protein n=1 Tax=Massilia sp. W12 TaxID=3126507 RepID=UPI0030D0B51E
MHFFDVKKAIISRFVFYCALALIASCIDFEYKWHSPLLAEKGLTESYASWGLHQGVILLGSAAKAEPGWNIGLHAPEFLPFLFHFKGSAEGGGFYFSVWFVALLMFFAHLRGLRKKK